MAWNLATNSNLIRVIKFLQTAINGITAGTVTASKVIAADANADVTGFRNITATGTVECVTLSNAKLSTATHNWASGTTAWAVSATEAKAGILRLTGTPGGGVDVVLPVADGKVYQVTNGTNQTATFKVTGQTGVGIATTKSAIIQGNATDYVRICGDA